ncbi:unnamed protein product, partial [Discosporangium mesarthrocarpum]
GGNCQVEFNHTGQGPSFPLQFSANLEVTAHMVDRSVEYPPWLRRMELNYDFEQRRAKVVIREGLDAGKTYLRLYDAKREYMIREGDFPVCRRSYLGEDMPQPGIPRTSVFQGMVIIDGVKCEHWLQDDGTSRVHIFYDHENQVPRRLTEEATPWDSEPVPMMTYDFMGVVIGQQSVSVFDLPESYTHKDCEIHVGGFPYLHLFHHYMVV